MRTRKTVSLTLLTGALVANTLSFTPSQFSGVRTDSSFGTIPGLLSRFNRRQGCSKSGYAECPDGLGCCPIGGRCCSTGCCDPGYFCHPTAPTCCPDGETTCHAYCMPIGAKCCPDGGYCQSDHYCDIGDNGEWGCCLNGKICTGSPGDPTTTTLHPTTTTTHTTPKPTSTTETTTTTIKTPPASPSTTDTTPGFSSTTSTASPSTNRTTTTTAPVTSPTRTFTLTGSPAATTGVTNTTVSATDTRITYSGNVAWSNAVAVSCISYSGATKKCSEEGGSITFSFTGTSIYLTVTSQPFTRLFSVSIDGGEAVTVDSYSATTQCAVAWAVWDLPNTSHTVKIVTLGPTTSGLHSGRRGFEAFEARQSGEYDFELVNVVYSEHNTGSGVTASASAFPGAGGGTGSATRVECSRPLVFALGTWLLSFAV